MDRKHLRGLSAPLVYALASILTVATASARDAWRDEVTCCAFFSSTTRYSRSVANRRWQAVHSMRALTQRAVRLDERLASQWGHVTEIRLPSMGVLMEENIADRCRFYNVGKALNCGFSKCLMGLNFLTQQWEKSQ